MYFTKLPANIFDNDKDYEEIYSILYAFLTKQLIQHSLKVKKYRHKL